MGLALALDFNNTLSLFIIYKRHIILIIFVLILFFTLWFIIDFYDSFLNMSGKGSGTGYTHNNSPHTGNSPNPGNGFNLFFANPDTSLPREVSSNTLGSSVSYSSDNLNQSIGSEIVNVGNILDDKTITDAKRKEEVLKSVTRLANELIQAKK